MPFVVVGDPELFVIIRLLFIVVFTFVPRLNDPLSDTPVDETVPVVVMFLKPVISLFESTITAFEADTVPAVMPVIVDKSTADPAINNEPTSQDPEQEIEETKEFPPMRRYR
jgi:hypothetical protein